MAAHPERFAPLWLPPLLAVAAVVNKDPRSESDVSGPMGRIPPLAATLYAILTALALAMWAGGAGGGECGRVHGTL